MAVKNFASSGKKESDSEPAKFFKKKETKKENVVAQEAPKKVVLKEEGQLIWFFAIIIMLFLAFLIPYLFLESKKNFEYSMVNWRIEDHNGLIAYHARFKALDNSDVNYNVYLREDPRENNVFTEGNFVDFRVDGYVALSEEVDSCRGEVARVMVDLGSFLDTGVGVGKLTVASNDLIYSLETGRFFVDCPSSNILNTIISIKMGEPRVIQSDENPYCYEIYVEDCSDISPVEKFITKTIGDVMDEKSNGPEIFEEVTD